MNSSGMQEGPTVASVEAPYGTVWGLCSGATPVARLAVSAAGGLRSSDLLLLSSLSPPLGVWLWLWIGILLSLWRRSALGARGLEPLVEQNLVLLDVGQSSCCPCLSTEGPERFPPTCCHLVPVQPQVLRWVVQETQKPCHLPLAPVQGSLFQHDS